MICAFAKKNKIFFLFWMYQVLSSLLRYVKLAYGSQREFGTETCKTKLPFLIVPCTLLLYLSQQRRRRLVHSRLENYLVPFSFSIEAKFKNFFYFYWHKLSLNETHLHNKLLINILIQFQLSTGLKEHAKWAVMIKYERFHTNSDSRILNAKFNLTNNNNLKLFQTDTEKTLKDERILNFISKKCKG